MGLPESQMHACPQDSHLFILFSFSFMRYFVFSGMCHFLRHFLFPLVLPWVYTCWPSEFSASELASESTMKT